MFHSFHPAPVKSPFSNSDDERCPMCELYGDNLAQTAYACYDYLSGNRDWKSLNEFLHKVRTTELLIFINIASDYIGRDLTTNPNLITEIDQDLHFLIFFSIVKKERENLIVSIMEKHKTVSPQAKEFYCPLIMDNDTPQHVRELVFENMFRNDDECNQMFDPLNRYCNGELMRLVLTKVRDSLDKMGLTHS